MNQKPTEDARLQTIPGTSFPAQTDGGGAHWDRGHDRNVSIPDRVPGTDLIQCPALQINIFSRLCKTVRDANYSDPFPQCATCAQRTDT